jgi:hypothetical protein
MHIYSARILLLQTDRQKRTDKQKLILHYKKLCKNVDREKRLHRGHEGQTSEDVDSGREREERKRR